MTSGGASSEAREVAAPKSSKLASRYRAFWHGLMAVVPIITLSLVCALPLLVIAYESMVVWDGLQPTGWGSLQGYRQVLQPQYFTVLRELILRGVLVATIDLVIAVPLADFIIRRKSATWRWILLMTLNVPFLVSGVSRAFGWFHILSRDGFVNLCWTSLIPHAQPIGWLIFSRTAVVITLVCATLAFAVFPIVLALRDNRDSLWSACDDIGIGPFTRLLRVVLPLSAPGALAGWFCVFWLAFGASVEASVVDGPTEISLGRTINDLLNANEYSAVYALSALIVLTFGFVGGLLYLLHYVRRSALIFQPNLRQASPRIVNAAMSLSLRKPNLYASPAVRKLISLFPPLAVGFVLLAFLLAPVWSILLLSISKHASVSGLVSSHPDFHWYSLAFQGDILREAWVNSLMVSIPVGGASAAIAFLIGLTWWNKRWRRMSITGLVVLALLPPDAEALGLLQIYKSLGFQQASLFLVGFSDFALALPFSTAVIFAVNSTIDPFLFSAGLEMGASRLQLVKTLLFGLTWPGVVSAFIIGFLLSLNDYTRASYLSGSNQMLSQYIYGQMKSGADPSVYAVGGINVVAAVVLFVVMFSSLKVTLRSTPIRSTEK